MFLCEWKMSGEDRQSKRGRGARGRHFSATEYSSADFKGDQPFGSTVRVPAKGGTPRPLGQAQNMIHVLAFYTLTKIKCHPPTLTRAYKVHMLVRLQCPVPTPLFIKLLAYIYRTNHIWCWASLEPCNNPSVLYNNHCNLLYRQLNNTLSPNQPLKEQRAHPVKDGSRCVLTDWCV